MADDLRNYKLQLQQVDAALISDPTNEELIKLKSDLQEVITLSQDLIKKQETDTSFGGSAYENNFGTEERIPSGPKPSNKKKKWTVGEKCLAKWEQNGQFYEALIEEITNDAAIVVFDGYDSREMCALENIKDLQQGMKRPLEEGDKGKAHSREYLKKKKQKKVQRFKQIEEERESEKNKWLSFSAKSSKKSGARGGKSIFASPDNVNGRVGIGTCGISGRPMTEFSHGEKWRKGA